MIGKSRKRRKKRTKSKKAKACRDIEKYCVKIHGVCRAFRGTKTYKKLHTYLTFFNGSIYIRFPVLCLYVIH